MALTLAFLIGGFISFVVTAVLVFLIGSSFSPDTDTHPAASREATLPQVGDCLAPSPSGVDLTSDRDVVECSTNHGSEVAAVLEMPGSSKAPSREDLDTYADDACLVAFSGYVGISWDDSDYDYLPIVPTEEAWEQGDTRVWCLIETYGDRGTVRNSHN